MPAPALYARYVPPKAVPSAAGKVQADKSETAITSSAGAPQKRKREDGVSNQEKKARLDRDHDANEQSVTEKKSSKGRNVQNLRKDNAVPSTTKIMKPKDPKWKSPADTAVEIELQSIESPKSVKKEKKKTKKPEKTQAEDEELDDDPTARHAGVFSKYQKALDKAASKATVDEVDVDMDKDEGKPEVHDLVPIPIPEQPPAPEPFAAALALPSWLAAPVKISQTTNVAFSDLLDTQLAKRMTSKGFSKALPVQAGVLPLLLPTPQQHPGDLCISAATGSGKTLAYVLPMVESLKAQRSRHLRALIVVPTRELVAQVRETAEMCSVGTSLRVGTAIGHHAFKSEQDMLVKRGQAYDQDGHEALRRKAESVDDSEMLETDYVEEFYDLLPFHVPEYTSNVDILICTPGRLVDHIKSTKGFTLQHLEWFVVDEADRLLDQSFQEWVEVLQTAMVSEPSEPQPGQSFRPLFLAPHLGLRPYGWVRKVVLSATLTRDLQKLSSLNLRNPKLVLVEGAVVESTEADVVKDSASGNFTLPSTLQEFGVPVGDGSEKPLYLLKLLRQIFDDGLIGKRITPKTQTEDVASDDNDDNSSTASSESSSDSSLSSDDDDDSDNDSDTSISSDSTSDSNSTISSTTSSSSSGASSTTSIALNPLSPPAVPDSKTNPSLTPSTQHNVLIFTSSTESATRLLHLLTHLHAPYKTQTTLLTKSSQKLPRHLLSSTQTPSTQSQASHTRSQAHGHIIISTDRASRGLDIPSLSAVINYDVPHSITSYIHRVGRTARAGRSGSAWTLVAEREARWFWNVIGKGTGSTAKGEGIRGMEGSEGIERPQGGGVKRVRVVVEEGERVGYVEALEALREEVERGRGGR